MNRRRRAIGDIVAIPIDAERTMFGWVLDDPLVAFFDVVSRAGESPKADAIARANVSFRIWVMHRALREWSVIGQVTPPPEERLPIWFAKHDAIAGKWTLTDGERDRPATGDEWRCHEPAAVWSAVHVIDRLRDTAEGRPNRWLESMRLASSTRT